ncbi:MAG: ABC transporter substrate-binding protein [Rhodospirillales bacterium]
MKRAWAALAVLFAITCFANAASAADKLSIAALRFVSSSPIFIAQERGYFAAEGLEVEIKFFDAAQPIAVATASGDTDLGITGLTAGFYNLAGKGAVKIIAAQSREEPGYNFVAYVVNTKAYDAGFKSVTQFPGKTVGITQIGSTFHYNLGKLAEKRGFKLEDVQLKPLQSIGNVTAALKGGQVDAVLLPANNAYALEKDGAGKIIGWVHQETPWQLGALFANTKAIETRRPAIEKFVRAYLKATADYADAMLQKDAAGNRVFGDKADAVIAIIQKYVEPKPSPEQVKNSANFIDPQGRLLVNDIYGQVRWYQANGMVDKNVDAGKLLDLGFVKNHLEMPKK